ncbi:unnamed protein product [Rhizoctonia solani]|uniref:Uncharacterized protein n=1 Tax=Rhizoctonia solani TaxID=456999 RepID=A0A8H3HD46_9AGAM|nr:unnamed protein product [Rhizoctonia solani]
MPETLHSRWGYPIGSYVPTDDYARLNLSVDDELAGLQAMQRISYLEAGTHMPTGTDFGSDIDLSTLESALRLARDPATIRHLVNPPAISGCVQLMKSVVGLRGDASPLSYQYGYLCFKLLSMVLNVCFMDRWNILEDTLEKVGRCQDEAAHLLVWDRLSLEIIDQYENFKDGGYCDWVLGWSVPPDPRWQPPLLLKLDVSALLKMLWDDRKFLLKALLQGIPDDCKFVCSYNLSTRSENFFLIRGFQQSLEWETLQTRLNELALRYMLVVDGNGREAMSSFICIHSCFEDWSDSTKHVDTEDSRLIMFRFINLISNCNEPNFLKSLHPATMLRLVHLAVNNFSQDLLPGVLECAMKYTWLVVIEQEKNENEIPPLLTILLGDLFALVCPPGENPLFLLPAIQSQIINVVYQSGLLDFTARVILRLDPAEPTFANFIHGKINGFFTRLASMIPPKQLEQRFLPYVADWWKIYLHLLTQKYNVDATPGSMHPSLNHYKKCIDTWLGVGHLLAIVIQHLDSSARGVEMRGIAVTVAKQWIGSMETMGDPTEEIVGAPRRRWGM